MDFVLLASRKILLVLVTLAEKNTFRYHPSTRLCYYLTLTKQREARGESGYPGTLVANRAQSSITGAMENMILTQNAEKRK